MRNLIFILLMCLGSFAVAQDDDTRSLGDMKLELEFLSSQIDGLRKELLESGAALSNTNSGPALTRLNAIEHELRVLTGQMEELEHRITTTISEMENKLGDLEFRMTEAEGGTPTKPVPTSDAASLATLPGVPSHHPPFHARRVPPHTGHNTGHNACWKKAPMSRPSSSRTAPKSTSGPVALAA